MKGLFWHKAHLSNKKIKNFNCKSVFSTTGTVFSTKTKQNLWRTSLVLRSKHSLLTACYLLWNIHIFPTKVSWVSSLDLGWAYPFPIPYTLASYILTFIRQHNWSSPIRALHTTSVKSLNLIFIFMLPGRNVAIRILTKYHVICFRFMETGLLLWRFCSQQLTVLMA